MDHQQHRQIALYASLPEAMRALVRLQDAGLSDFKLRLIQEGSVSRSLPRRDDAIAMFDLLVRGAIQGALAGALIGVAFVLLIASGGTASWSAAAYLLLVLSVVSLAAVGGALLNAGGRLFGAGQRIRRALDQGKVVLLVHPDSNAEARRVQRLIREPATPPWG